jgi:hypothetical protein
MIEAARLQNGIAIAAWPAAVMFAVMAFTGPWDTAPKTPALYAYLILFPVFGGLLFFVGISLFNWFIAIPLRTSSLHRQNPLFFGELELIEDADGVEFKGARSTARYRWSELRGFKESRKIFLLCLSKSVSYPIPKRGLSQQTIDHIRERWGQKLRRLN